MARELACSLAEVFGEIDEVDAEYHAAILEASQRLTLLDLRGPAAMRAGTKAAIGAVPRRAETQPWSRYFYETYPAIDGLLYSGSHNGLDALALFERADGRIRVIRGGDVPITHADLRPVLLSAAAECGLVVPW